ncbi:MAG: ATP synthase F0 subunit B [Thermoflexales bacterium]|nr:ATP synthase F0 subunit B [Thermoflexales bacterium]MCS7324985.1 ATP synthase F0 subunit B [Thermoflexales bacterium]MCX7938668.1 ATP synthase F0 subunit B [Thermoflexales bacterium]MDW8053873.1 ATP synthase F0 subunit B [Anaerolineae bacterium]MDW8292404.1 ATP synthase F0 subunit B [Anaerolineae bacterium]
MDIQHLLNRLENLVLESPRVPGSKLRLIDETRCLQLIDQMVLAIPSEVKEAQRVQQERERILEEARAEASRIVRAAQEEAARLVEESQIVEQARNRAAVIEERARREAEQLRAEAERYALETLLRLREELENTQSVVSNGILKLQSDIEARLQSVAALDQLGAPEQESRRVA